jgi:transcriptional regulator with XRE-family HTH domain
MATEFGKRMKILRIERDELLKDMAEKLGMSAAYLSSIESGDRSIPIGFAQKVIAKYNLCDMDAAALQNAADVSTSVLKVDVANVDSIKKKTLALFARSLDQLSTNDLQGITEIIRKNRHAGQKVYS